MRLKFPTFRTLASLFIAFAMCFQSVATANAYVFFSDDEYELKAYKLILNSDNSFAEADTSIQFGNDVTGNNATVTWDTTNDRLIFDNEAADKTLQFGNDSSDGFVTWDDSASTFVLGSDTTAGADRNNLSAEIEAVSALPGGASGLGTSGEGRLVILDTADNTAPGCTVSPNCSAGTYIWDGAAWISLVGSPTSTNLTKVVTVGSSGADYTTISAAATYLQTRSGGIMLLAAETHNITTAVNLTNTTLIGKDPSRTTIAISGSGQLDTFDTTFEFLTLDINSITDTMAIDIQTGSTSLIFNYVEIDVQDSGDFLIDSNSATAPTVVMKIIKSNQSGTNGKILDTKTGSNLNSASTIFVDSRSNDDPLNLSDWDVTVAGGGSVLTNGYITSVPARTIYVSPNMNLQGAIDSLENAGNGGLITLLPGTHAITATLTVDDDDIHIVGYGDSSVISASGITGGSTVGAIQVGAANGTAPVNGVVLKDFKLAVTGTGGTDIHGIRVAGGSDNRVDNVTVEKVSGASGTGSGARMGIQMIDGATTNLIRPVIFKSRVLGTSTASAYFTDGIHVTSDSTISGVFGNGNRVVNALLDGNFVDYVRETAYVFVGADDSSLFNNRATNMGAGGTTAYGIYMGNATNINMTANVFTGSLSSSAIAIGIECFVPPLLITKTTSDSLFNNNIIRGSGSGFATGFQIGSAARTIVSRNQFQNNQIYGASTAATTIAIDIFGDADENIFSNNTITGNGNSWTYGVRLNSSTQDQNIVSGNRFSNTTTHISDTGTATIFSVGTAINTGNPTTGDDIGDGYGIGTLWINTTSDDAYILLDNASGAAVWTQIDAAGSGSTPDFEGVYTQDVDKALTTTNGIFTIDTGTNDFVVDSNDWSVDTSGNLVVNGITMNGIGVFGDGGDDISINSNDWDISSAGVASGLTGITSTGTVDFSGATNITIPHTNSATFTLDNDNTGAGANVSIVAEQGTDLNGALRYNATTNLWELSNNGGGYVPLAGWHGSQTRIKLTPADFQPDDADDNMTMLTSGAYTSASSGTVDPVATIAIPTGYRATHVMVYGSDTGNAVTAYANDIANGTTATSLGTGNIGTELNITDLDSSTTNYLSVYIDVGNGDQIYGGYVTITPIP